MLVICDAILLKGGHGPLVRVTPNMVRACDVFWLLIQLVIIASQSSYLCHKSQSFLCALCTADP
jgi:hypothetical protein